MVWTTVLIVQIVRMLPDIKGQQGLQALLNRIGSIRLLRDNEFALCIS